MNFTKLTVATLIAAFAVCAQAQTPAPKAASKAPAPAAAAPAVPAGKALYPPSEFDLLLKERVAQGTPDTPELRNSVREELNTRELLAREAKKKGLDKTADVKTQMELAAQTVLVRAYVNDWVKNNPIPDADMRKEYENIKAQIGDKEYKIAHILVEKEDEAKEVIADLQKGQKFADLAKARSKDPGSKDKGGDLDWNAPANFVKPFADAVIATPKGKFTTTPIQTQFGWHVIMVEDVRPAKVPSFDEVKPQLIQRMQPQYLDKYFKELRAKNGV
ncbi:MAG: peptidylprolyl isomerase [Casimicrobiaceae bacterium]